MTYNFVVLSAVQQSESVTHIHVFTVFSFFSPIDHYRVPVEFSMLCNRFLLVVYFICSTVYMCFRGGSDSKGFACSEGRPGMETWDPSLDWEDPLQEEMTTHSGIFTWRIPWTEEPGRLQSIGSQRVELD